MFVTKPTCERCGWPKIAKILLIHICNKRWEKREKTTNGERGKRQTLNLRQHWRYFLVADLGLVFRDTESCNKSRRALTKKKQKAQKDIKRLATLSFCGADTEWL